MTNTPDQQLDFCKMDGSVVFLLCSPQWPNLQCLEKPLSLPRPQSFYPPPCAGCPCIAGLSWQQILCWFAFERSCCLDAAKPFWFFSKTFPHQFLLGAILALCGQCQFTTVTSSMTTICTPAWVNPCTVEIRAALKPFIRNLKHLTKFQWLVISERGFSIWWLIKHWICTTFPYLIVLMPRPRNRCPMFKPATWNNYKTQPNIYSRLPVQPHLYAS